MPVKSASGLAYPGQPFRPSAHQWNAFQAAADAHQRQALGSPRTPGSYVEQGSNTVIMIRNDCGADRKQFEILGLDDVLFTPDDNLQEFLNSPAFKAVEPATADHRTKFVILLEPIAEDRIGLALLYGLTAVKLNVTDANHTHAVLSDGVYTKLRTAFCGPAQILWKQSGTGEKWAWVALYPFQPSIICKADSTIPVRTADTPGSGTVSIYDFDADTDDLIDTGVNMTAYNTTGTAVEASRYLQAKPHASGHPLIDVQDCAG
jgi:hypothetical protein